MNLDKYKNKRVLVTGGSGFIPSHLVKKLHSIGSEVFVITKYNSVIDNIRLAKIWDQITPIEADIRNLDSCLKIKDYKPDYVFHMAAYNHVGDSFIHVQESLMSNALGTANVMEAYSDYDRFVYISTSEVYGYQDGVPFIETMTPFPISPYAVGKYAGEQFAQMKHHVSQLPITIIRPFNAFGPYQSPKAVIAEMIIKCLRGETIKSTEGKQTRDFNFVENLVDGILMAALNESAIGTPLNLGSGQDIPIKDLITMIHKLTDSKSELQIGILPNRPTEIWEMRASFTKAQEVLKWQPKVGLEEGLKRSVEWYREFNKVFTNPESPLLNL